MVTTSFTASSMLMSVADTCASIWGGGAARPRAGHSGTSSAASSDGRIILGKRITGPSPILARAPVACAPLGELLLHRRLHALERLEHRLGVLLVDVAAGAQRGRSGLRAPLLARLARRRGLRLL